MKKTAIILIVLVALLSTSCSLFQGRSDELILRSELKKWERLKGDGVIEFSVFGITMRKPFNLSKNVDEMRLDIVEGGIFGSGSSPLLSMYLGPYLALQSSAIPALANTKLDDLMPEGLTAFFASADYLYDKYGAEIIKDKAVERKNLIVSFGSDYKLEEIRDKGSNTVIKNQYTRHGELDSIELKSQGFISAKMVFDHIEYEHSSIIPLPKNDNATGGLMDVFKNNNMFDMLKGFLGDK